MNKTKSIAILGIILIFLVGSQSDLLELQNIDSHNIRALDLHNILFAVLLLCAGWAANRLTGFTITSKQLQEFINNINVNKNFNKKQLDKFLRRNFCSALLTNENGETKKYYSISGNLNSKTKDQLAEQINSSDGTLCLDTLDDTGIYPITKRLDYDVKWKPFKSIDKQIFALSRSSCTERKILRHLLNEYKGREDELRETVLEICTEYEPCIYCFDLLTEVKDSNIFKEIYVYYPDMVFEFEEQVPGIKNHTFEKIKKEQAQRLQKGMQKK